MVEHENNYVIWCFVYDEDISEMRWNVVTSLMKSRKHKSCIVGGYNIVRERIKDSIVKMEIVDNWLLR